MHIAPRAPPFATAEPPSVGHRYPTAKMAAAEEPRIIARLIPHPSAVVQSFLHVFDDVLRLHDLTVVFAHQPPIRSDQHHVDQVANRTVRLDLSAELETRQRPIDVRGTSGQEIPSLLICPLLT